MVEFDWPSGLIPQSVTFQLQKSGVMFRGGFNGNVQAHDFNGERFMLDLVLPPRSLVRDVGRISAARSRALINRLTGAIDWVRCWNFEQPIPLGTMRGTPTLRAQAVRDDSVLLLSNAGANATLFAGDLIGCSTIQLFEVQASVQATAGGLMDVTVNNRARGTIANGTVIVWRRPTAPFLVPSFLGTVTSRPGVREGSALHLEEVWIP